MPRRWLSAPLLLSILAVALLWQSETRAAPDFEIDIVKTSLDRPWSINFAPDGRLFFTSRSDTSIRLRALNLVTGEIQVFNSSPPSPVRVESEAGVLGMELDPNFAENGWVYICYSTYGAGMAKQNRLSRFTVNVGSATIGDELPLIDGMVGALTHNGCRVVVSPDNRYLFVTMGDASNASLAQNLDSSGGKTFRIFKDGSVPTDNPFYAAGQLPRSLIWTLGHRNHQGLAFQPATGRLWSTEHGPSQKDELNLLQQGRNYGWPTCLGIQPACAGVANYAPAIAEYDTDVTVATSDMTFYTGNAFPEWQGNLFFVTLKTGRLYRLRLNNETVAEQEILINFQYGRLRDVTVGPDGYIYISTDNGGSNDRILRLRAMEIERPFRAFLPFVHK